jgi:hypothetical protein
VGFKGDHELRQGALCSDILKLPQNRLMPPMHPIEITNSSYAPCLPGTKTIEATDQFHAGFTGLV